MATLQGVEREPLAYDAFLAGRSVARVRGIAVTSNGTVPWSMIEKVTEGPAVASAYLYDNAVREFHAYDSGILDDLAPSVTAPTAYGVHTRADGRLSLWLEDVGEPRRLSSAEIVSTGMTSVDSPADGSTGSLNIRGCSPAGSNATANPPSWRGISDAFAPCARVPRSSYASDGRSRRRSS